MSPQQRAAYVETVTLNIDGVYPGKVRDAERIVDRVIAPALAFAWHEGRYSSEPAGANPYEVHT